MIGSDHEPESPDEAQNSDFGSLLPISPTTSNPYDELAATAADPQALAFLVQEQRSRLNDSILNGKAAGVISTAVDTTRSYSDLIDAVVRRMYTLACAASGTNPSTLQMAIVATGGYGRRELAPFSDIDVTFIPLRDGDAHTDRVVKELFRLVMDVFIAKCGLEVGYAYRLLSDCGSLDHQTVTGLMDARCVAGSQRLFIQFEDAFWDSYNAPEFIFTKIDERNTILKKHGFLPRGVEPQLKEGPGGLRDIQTAVWLVQAREHLAATRVRGNRGLLLLSREVGLTEREVDSLVRAKEMLFKVRNALHAISGAERDQLVVTRQEDVADALGYGNVGIGDDRPPAVERFMADLFPAMALCRRVADRVTRTVSNSRLLLGIGLDCVNRRLVAANGSLSKADPVWLAWACELTQRYGLQMSDDLQVTAAALLEEGGIL